MFLNLLNIQRAIILSIQRIDLHIQASGELRSLFINGHPINKISLKSIK